MSQADRKYRERARRRREAERRNKETASKAAAFEEDLLRRKITDQSVVVLDLLKKADSPDVELIQVSGKSAFWRNKRAREVAGWLLNSGRRVEHDESTEFKFWLLSNGKLAFGGSGSSASPLDLESKWWANDNRFILEGLEHLTSTLTVKTSRLEGQGFSER